MTDRLTVAILIHVQNFPQNIQIIKGRMKEDQRDAEAGRDIDI